MKSVKDTMWLPTILDELFGENSLESINYESFSIPKVNIKENNETLVIEIADPGLTKESFTIEQEKKILKVSSNVAPTTSSTEGTSAKYIRKEFNYSSFKKSFRIPETVNMEEIEATYKNGILLVSLPKKEAKKEFKRMVEIS